mgnify:CR=1 FL=1
MSFNPLKEKGIPIEKQIRNWHQIVGKPYNKTEVDCYTRGYNINNYSTGSNAGIRILD